MENLKTTPQQSKMERRVAICNNAARKTNKRITGNKKQNTV